jgi:hypothetical protein
MLAEKKAEKGEEGEEFSISVSAIQRLLLSLSKPVHDLQCSMAAAVQIVNRLSGR